MVSVHFFVAKRAKPVKSVSSRTSSSEKTTISTAEIRQIVEKLRVQRCRDSTRATYHRIWKIFSDFYFRLDDKPTTWEDRIILFMGHLVNNNLKSSTIRSYISALRTVLAEDGHEFDHQNFVISSLTRACKIRNDKIVHRLPIHKGVLKLILDQTMIWTSDINQPYLQTLYLAMISSAYYGLLRIGEIADSQHCLLAKNVHIVMNKQKMLFLLPTSKTHSKGNKPQMIKITSTPVQNNPSSSTVASLPHNKYCPYLLLKSYIAVRPNSVNDAERFFVFSDRSPIGQLHFRKVVKAAIGRAGLDPTNYSVHGLRNGRASDLLKLGVSVETIKKLGR